MKHPLRYLLTAMTVVLLAQAGRGEEIRPAELVAEAVRSVDQIENPEDQARLLGRAAVVQGKLGNRPAATELIRQAVERSEPMEDPYRRVNLLVTLAGDQAKSGDAPGARRTLQQALLAAESHHRALSVVAKALAERGDRAAAEKAFERAVQAVDPVEPVKKLVSIAKDQQAVKDEQGAEATLKKAYEVLTGERNVRSRISGLREIGFVRAGSDPHGGMKLLQLALIESDAINDKEIRIGERIDILLAMAEVQGRTDRGSAATILRSALSEGDALSKGEIKNRKLSALSIAQAKLGDLKAAFETKKRIEDHWGQNETLLPTVDAQLEAGDLPGALKSALSIDAKDFLRRDMALGRVAGKQAQSGDLDGALKSVEQIQYEPAKSTALAAVLEEQTKRGEAQPALKTATARNSPMERALGLIAIASGLLEKGP